MEPRNHKLFTTSNAKTRKGEKTGVYTIILHLAPSDLSGQNVCPMASPGCIATCLNTAGRGRFDNVQAARIRKTQRYLDDVGAFRSMLAQEIAWHERKARKLGMTLAVRTNGTSDLPAMARQLAGQFPSVQFYDYTKIPLAIECNDRSNLHYTFSRTEDNEEACRRMLALGVNVAVVFAGKKLPTTYLGVPVIDGDEHDLRFLDPRSVVVGLRAKGAARKDESGFVVASEVA